MKDYLTDSELSLQNRQHERYITKSLIKIHVQKDPFKNESENYNSLMYNKTATVNYTFIKIYHNYFLTKDSNEKTKQL